MQKFTQKDKYLIFLTVWVVYMIFLMVQNTFLIFRIGELMQTLAVQGQAVFPSKDIFFLVALLGTEYALMFLMRGRVRELEKELKTETKPGPPILGKNTRP